MIVIICAITGALLGAYSARKRGGGGLDIAQYTAGYAMAFIVFGLIATVVVERIAF